MKVISNNNLVIVELYKFIAGFELGFVGDRLSPWLKLWATLIIHFLGG